MNAYELADKCGLKIDDYGFAIEIQEGVIDMLRQQAEKINNMEIWEKKYLDRIAELEKELNIIKFEDLGDDK